MKNHKYCVFLYSKHRGVEQMVARRAHNPKALGSSPSPATKNKSFSPTFGLAILFLKRFSSIIACTLLALFGRLLFTEHFKTVKNICGEMFSLQYTLPTHPFQASYLKTKTNTPLTSFGTVPVSRVGEVVEK